MPRRSCVWLVVGLMVMSWRESPQAQEGAPEAWRAVYEEFSAEKKRARAALAGTYGSGWSLASLTSEIRREAEWLNSEESSLQWDFHRLESSAKSLNEERDLQNRKSKLLQLDYESLDRELIPLNAQEARWKELKADCLRRAAIHNASPPDHMNEAAVAEYNRIAEAGNAELMRINRELADVAALKERVEERRRACDVRALELASRLRYFERRAEAHAEIAGQFLARCQGALARARGLAIIGSAKPADLIRGYRHVTETRPHAIVELIKSGTESAALGALGKLAVRGTPVVGHALTMRELFGPQIKKGGEAVEDKLLLIGDYAKAMERLKKQGKLEEGDPDYEAVRTMLRTLGREMPPNEAEFVVQSTKLSELLRDGVENLAKGYVLKKVFPDNPKLTVSLTRKEKENISQMSSRLVSVFESTAQEEARSQAFNLSWDQIRERSAQDWEEAGRKSPRREGR